MNRTRHYEVISPEMEHWSQYEPSEPFRCWGVYLARNAKDARVQAVRDPAFKEWVDEARGDRTPPFKGLEVHRTLCEHGRCWGCDGSVDLPSCPECLSEVQAQDAAYMAEVGS